MNFNIYNSFQFRKYLKNRNTKINETAGPHKFGCIMGYIEDAMPEIEVDESKLYNPFTHGIETEPHVTMLYGILPDVDPEEVFEFLRCLKMPKIKLSEISLFENDEFDVVKYDVESEELFTMNKLCTMLFPFENKFPEYHPHVTIAYMLPGEGKSYVEKFDNPKERDIAYWIYSLADGTKYRILSSGDVSQLNGPKEGEE